MAIRERVPLEDLDQHRALRTILEGTATETGAGFFQALVKNLAEALNTHGAWVTEYLEETNRLRALAFWLAGDWVQDYEVDIEGTPCQIVVETASLVHFPDNMPALYPNDPDIIDTGAVSYMGAPLLDVDGNILGHLAVLDTQSMPAEPRVEAIFRIFAARAAAELRRLRAEADVREREEKLSRLVDSALDAIIELDSEYHVTRANPAAEKVFGVSAAELVGQPFTRLLVPESGEKLANLVADLEARPEGQQYLWVPGGLRATRPGGEAFQAEATLSRFLMDRRPYLSLILRNVNERLEAERKIRSLTKEAQYLREEIRALEGFDEIIGESPPMLRLLKDIEQVAGTDTTVLILGETGTGKELVARAIHERSRRRTKPFVKVNCAAIPSTLMESEFFGHERGAFTGATAKREGRFALADGGTIFLDEIGELTADLQAKLLRVLQEGEFEPVGSSRTRKVDVRVVAATNRDLEQDIRDGKFREDLYYRLNVFPLQIPPLRERGDDLILLADAYAKKYAQRIGRPAGVLSESSAARLRAYNWPGNVRELQNVIERAVITSSGDTLDLDRALPAAAEASKAAPSAEELKTRVRTVHELQDFERDNILRALEQCNWRVSGKDGAAQLLDMKPSTLSSRIKALRIERPSNR